ncbi:MAG: D-2-hydroxyacid dehydrogenase [Clostridiales bacterium]|nr:D-2-hydroxyacid dehydrogenase [Candidatus Cacconaster stercorequi]
MRKIAVVDDFLTPAHCDTIRAAAAELGFAVDFYPDRLLPAGHEGDYEILFGRCSHETLKSAKNLKWYCCSFAGVDDLLRDELYPNPNVVLTNSSGAYGITISEHVIMVLLMMMRRMPEFEELVRQQQWQREMPMRSIRGCSVTMLGTGDIGTNIARRVKGMGAKTVRGVRRTQKPADPAFDEIYTFEHLDELLPSAEVLIMAMPSTPDTIGILSRERIALLPKDALVINVGRGTAVDQDALIEALEEERIAGAALDVMVPEPPEKDHPLWHTKNLLLTPHTSGNMSLGLTCDLIVEEFCADLRSYAAGLPLKHLVDRSRGY